MPLTGLFSRTRGLQAPRTCLQEIKSGAVDMSLWVRTYAVFQVNVLSTAKEKIPGAGYRTATSRCILNTQLLWVVGEGVVLNPNTIGIVNQQSD